MTLPILPLLFSLACSDAVQTDDTASDDTGATDTADTADTGDTDDTFTCDFSAIAGEWEGSTPQGADQALNLEPSAEEKELIGINELFRGSEDPLCIFEMSCRIPMEGTQYQVYNTVAPGSSNQCGPGWYTFQAVGDELQVEFHTSQDSSPLLTYTLQAK